MGKRMLRITPEVIIEMLKPQRNGDDEADFTLLTENPLPADAKLVETKWDEWMRTVNAIIESVEWDEQTPTPEIDSPTVHIRRWPRVAGNVAGTQSQANLGSE